MAKNSGIGWTHHTFNPWIGCTRVSPACDNCYAEAWDRRFGRGARWGGRASRTRTKTWGQPLQWNREAQAAGTRHRVFCASLADVFDNHGSITSGWHGDLWHLIHRTPHLDWLLLTKRPQNIAGMLPESYGAPEWGEGWPNVWLGTTVENQEEANRRIPHLLAVPARVRFLSCEPLLGPVDLTDLQMKAGAGTDHYSALFCDVHPEDDTWGGATIDWVIAGGESGPNHRVADPDWFRSLRDQCALDGLPFFFKQWEGRTPAEVKARGRELDGVVHDAYPQPRFARAA